MSSELDLDVDVRRQVEAHERIDGLGGRVDDVDEPLVRALCLETDEAARVCDRRDRVSREALGDYSVSYFESMPDTVCGIPVSSEAILALTGGGYLTRWA